MNTFCGWLRPFALTALPAGLQFLARLSLVSSVCFWGGTPLARAEASATNAAALMMLVDEGRVRVDDPVEKMSSGNGVAEDCRRTAFRRSDNEGHYVYFTVDPPFVPYGTRELQFTVVAKRVAPGTSFPL